MFAVPGTLHEFRATPGCRVPARFDVSLACAAALRPRGEPAEKFLRAGLDGIELVTYCTSVLVRQLSGTRRERTPSPMTRHIEVENRIRETRTPVRLPVQTSSPMFQGWGPKF